MVKIVEAEAGTHTAPLLAELMALWCAGNGYITVPQALLLCCTLAQLQQGEQGQLQQLNVLPLKF